MFVCKKGGPGGRDAARVHSGSAAAREHALRAMPETGAVYCAGACASSKAMAGHHTDHRNMGTEIDAYQKSRHHDKAVADVR
jgi:hypothetical protein